MADARRLPHRSLGAGAGAPRAAEDLDADEGGRITSPRFTDAPRDADVRISMDGGGRWRDDVFIERLRRSRTYERIHLHAFETGSELRAGVRRGVDDYNAQRPHSALGGRTPDEAHAGPGGCQAAA